MKYVVQTHGAAKHFGNVNALLPTDLSIQPGEIVALLGPNGAGKTTFVSLALGLRKPSSGTVSLFGDNPRDRRARSRCGVMLQETGVPEFLRVCEIVDLFRTFYRAPLSRDEALAMAGLEDKSQVLIHTLSGGQRQRLYFSLAVCGNPEALFLDEPTIGMDVEMRRKFWEQLRNFGASGRTILLTTHYLEEADAIATRIVVINKGRIIADAPPRVLKDRVESKRVSFDAAIHSQKPDLSALPIQRVLELDGRMNVFTTDPQAVLRALLAADYELANLEVVGASLEDAVLGLTSSEET